MWQALFPHGARLRVLSPHVCKYNLSQRTENYRGRNGQRTSSQNRKNTGRISSKVERDGEKDFNASNYFLALSEIGLCGGARQTLYARGPRPTLDAARLPLAQSRSRVFTNIDRSFPENPVFGELLNPPAISHRCANLAVPSLTPPPAAIEPGHRSNCLASHWQWLTCSSTQVFHHV